MSAQLTSGAAARLVTTGVDALTGLLAVSICVRLLGVSVYGVLAFLFSVVTLVAGVGGLGWGVATTYAISASVEAGDPAGAARAARAATGLAAVAGLAGAVVVTVVSLTVGSVPEQGTRLTMGLCLGVLLCGSTLGWAASAVARALGRVAAAETPYLVLGVVRLAALLAVASTGTHSLAVVALAYGVAGALTAGVSLALSRRLLASLGPPRAGHRGRRELIVAAGPFAVQGLAALVITRFDVLVLGLTADSAAVGAYEPTLRATERLMQLAAFLALAQFLPAATSLWASGDRTAFRRLYRATTKLCYLAAMLGAVVLVAFPERVLGALYGDAYPTRPGIVWVLLLGYLPYAALAPSWHALAAVGERRALVVASAVTFATMVATALVLIPLFGAMGAALSTAGSVVVLQVVMARALWQRAAVHAFDGDMLALVGGSAVLLLVAAVVRWRIDVGSLAPAIAGSIGMWLAFVAAVAAVTIRRRQPIMDST